MGQLEEQLVRQVVAVLLYNRRFHRVSRPALDIIANVFEAVIVALWRRAGRAAELTGTANAGLPVALEELLRLSQSLYIDRQELNYYEQEQPILEYSSVLEERGIVTNQLRVLAGTRIDPKLYCIVQKEDKPELDV